AALVCSLAASGIVLAPASPADATVPGVNGLIAFGNSGIGVVHADGRGATDLTVTANDTAPAWSPDGTRIAFVSGSAGSNDVWVMDADGSHRVDLTADSAAADGAPAWAPAGTQIAFQSDRSGDQEIFVMDAD